MRPPRIEYGIARGTIRGLRTPGTRRSWRGCRAVFFRPPCDALLELRQRRPERFSKTRELATAKHHQDDDENEQQLLVPEAKHVLTLLPGTIRVATTSCQGGGAELIAQHNAAAVWRRHDYRRRRPRRSTPRRGWSLEYLGRVRCRVRARSQRPLRSTRPTTKGAITINARTTASALPARSTNSE